MTVPIHIYSNLVKEWSMTVPIHIYSNLEENGA